MSTGASTTEEKKDAPAGNLSSQIPAENLSSQIPAENLSSQIPIATPEREGIAMFGIDPRSCEWEAMKSAAALAEFNLKSFVIVTDAEHSWAEKRTFGYLCCEAVAKIEKNRPGITKELKLIMMTGDTINCALKWINCPESDIAAVLVSPYASDRKEALQDLETRTWLKKGLPAPDNTYILCNLLHKDAEGRPMVAIMM